MIPAEGAVDDGGEPSEAAGPSKLAPGLYLVATPIGHARDVTLRALDVLAGADLIACEDTRITRRLLAIHKIRARLTPYHEHNAEAARPRLLARLGAGAAIALVSDAGTPLVSDPGYKLVQAVIAAGIAVTAVPGASAALAALQLSGLPTDRFLCAGFLPAKAAARRRALESLAPVEATLVLFESAPRLAACLADAADVFGARLAAVARELTKWHEEVRRDSLAALARHYAAAGPPRGEVVLVIAPPAPAPAADAATVDAALADALTRLSLSDAVAEVAGAFRLPRRAVYGRALVLRSLR
ncbi:MAG: 16S rRNA (cytidine(1402)-2'-O)-methyltransferase [Alphaproteobacteria bacterium]|nr:16S rRNA (cytidine(1402)-2'-O)-methyltransferase [Alphaproteobacteria bacterium]